jgi:hypothetical protein
MFNARLYRAALLPAVIAFVVMMFSFEPIPNAIEEPVATPEFGGTAAARQARQIALRAEDRTPGSEGDRTIAATVRDAFEAIEGARVSTQSFDADYRGDDVTLENVILTIPGASDDTILVIASRDSDRDLGAASSAAATAQLLALARALGTQRHERTIVLVSTVGGSEGALGTRELLDALPRPEDVKVAIALSQPGVETAAAPFVLPWGTGPESADAQLVQTARSIASRSFGERDPSPGPWASLSRLAFPAGLSEAAPLRGEGVEAIGLSANGERLIPPEEDRGVSSETMQNYGTAALDLILTLDEAPAGAPDAGPSDYVRLGGNLVPGWSIALLALTLLIAPIVTAAETWGREQRENWRTRRTIPWALERALLPLAALLLLYALSLIGLVPHPPWPYDPADYSPGLKGPIVAVALLGAAALAALLVRPMRTPLDSQPHTLAAAAGLITGGALVVLWFLNPYLTLLLFPAASVWMLPARASGPPRALIVGAVAALSLVGALAAAVTVSAQLDLGLAGPWHLLLMIADGQIGLGTSVVWCVLLGGLIACVSATAADRRVTPAGGSLRGAGSHVGPGALGSVPAAEARRR